MLVLVICVYPERTVGKHFRPRRPPGQRGPPGRLWNDQGRRVVVLSAGLNDDGRPPRPPPPGLNDDGLPPPGLDNDDRRVIRLPPPGLNDDDRRVIRLPPTGLDDDDRRVIRLPLLDWTMQFPTGKSNEGRRVVGPLH